MTSKSFLFVIFCTLATMGLQGQGGMEYYLPEMEYDQAIPTPHDVLGYNIGEWHITHDQLLIYLKVLANVSDRIEIVEYARSHEHRPLIYLMISTPDNLKRKNEIRQMSVDLADPAESNSIDISNVPALIYQGYTIHGNESSGASAAVLTAYYLAAGKGETVTQTLENTFILLDPCYNPDGFNRFASWVNSHKSKHLVKDAVSRELNEVWPKGRTNHYWFDLNRDWLLLTHPESQGRIKVYHEWKPNVLTDHHEMGSNSTFFFQPGIPSRTNPNTPQLNQDLTEKIGTYHAAALDSIGSLYYTKASFDDYYYGKGSTYPDANGCIGILFEQASSRGHLHESVNGDLSFPFTIRNQFVTSLSTQKAVVDMREELLRYKRDFFINQKKKSEKSNIKGYIVSDDDKAKMAHFYRILSTHQVQSYHISKDIKAEGKTFTKENSMYIPAQQAQSLMVKTIFEKVRTFPDSLFYDVSTWTMPLAFDIDVAKVKSAPSVGELIEKYDVVGKLYSNDAPYAYVLDWNNYNAPAALFSIMNRGIRTKVINDQFSILSQNKLHQFDRGDVIIPVQGQDKGEIRSAIDEAIKQYGVDVYGVDTGWGDSNMTLGNPNIDVIIKPHVAMIVGEGVTSYDAGEVWFQCDQRYGIPMTMIDKRQLSRASLNQYNVLIMCNGYYRDLSKSEKEKIVAFVADGGNLMLFRNAIKWGISNNLVTLDKKDVQYQEPKDIPAEHVTKHNGAQVLGGAIFQGEMDLSHPLCYGYDDSELPLFRRGTTFYESTKNAVASPVRYARNPILSGYVPRRIDEVAAQMPAVSVHKKDKGKVICFQDNLLFRGYWYGGSMMFANALFFNNAISSSTMERN